MWFCTIEGFPTLPFASPEDVSGGTITCKPIYVYEPDGPPYGIFRSFTTLVRWLRAEV